MVMGSTALAVELQAARTEIAALKSERDALLLDIERLKRAMVTAVIPLEAISLSGTISGFCEEVQDAIIEGITAVREILSALSAGDQAKP